MILATTLPTCRTLLLSIRPRHANRILARTKTVELRRTRPRLAAGDRMIIYVSSPERAIAAWATIGEVIEREPSRLWPLVRDRCGISKGEFDEYFLDAQRGFGIVLGRLHTAKHVLSLRKLRTIIPGFRPPQCYMYLRRDRASDQLLLEKVMHGGRRPVREP